MTQSKPARWLVIASFAAIYLFWSGSYIGIHYAVETIPPYLMTGVRFVLGGVALFAWARLRGAPMPTPRQWLGACIAGFLLFVLNNGGIVYAEKHGMPTGMVALLIATSPLWIVLINWARGGGKPSSRVWAGLGIGFIGMLLLIGPGSITRSGEPINLLLVAVVLGAAFCWATGSMYAKVGGLSNDPIMATSMQLLAGGTMQMLLSVGTGELATFHIEQVSLNSAVAFVYLTIFSSVIAYSAFVWLMRVGDPAKVATYAYVNPVLAVILGWVLAGERLTVMTLVAAGVILVAVAMISGLKLPSLRPRRAAPIPAAVGAVGD